MNLAEALQTSLPSKRCKFREWVDSLPEVDRGTVDAALENPDYSIRYLHRVFSEFGLDAGESVVWKHRSKQCRACP